MYEQEKMDRHQGTGSDIMELRAEGKTRQEIADKLGLDFVQIKNWVNWHNREQKRADAGLPPKRRGHPCKDTITSEAEYQYEINRLRMENKLLRDFCNSQEGSEVTGKILCYLPPSLRDPVSVMCRFFGVSRGGYYV